MHLFQSETVTRGIDATRTFNAEYASQLTAMMKNVNDEKTRGRSNHEPSGSLGCQKKKGFRKALAFSPFSFPRLGRWAIPSVAPAPTPILGT